MTLCPVALVTGCEKCPAFKICPLKGVIGDYKDPGWYKQPPGTQAYAFDGPAPVVERAPQPETSAPKSNSPILNLKKGDGVLDQCRVAAAKTCPAVGRLNDVHRRLITVEIAAGLLPRGPCLAALGAALERFVDPLMESSELRCLLFDVIVVTHEGRVRAA